MGLDESGTLAALRAHRRELIDPKIAEHDGRIVKGTGDGLLLEFPSVVDAVRCAVEVQRGMAERNTGIARDQRLDFRIGINVGDIIIDGDDIFGDGVNVAARLEALADPGGICVSRVVRDQVLDKLSFTFEDLGAQEVKNIARPVEVYRIYLETAAAPAPGRFLGLLRRATRASRKRWLAIGAVVLGLGALAMLALPHFRNAVSPSAPSPLSVAILPFGAPAGSVADQQFANVLTQDVALGFGRFRGARVVAAGTTEKYRKMADAREIGRELNVRYMVKGEVRHVGEKVIVDVQVIEAATATQVWSNRLEFEGNELTPEQRKLLAKVTREAYGAVFGAEVARADKAPPANASAMEFVLHADNFWARNPVSVAGAAEAGKLFDKALQIDPGLVPALDGKSGALYYLYFLEPHANRESIAREMEELTTRAVNVDEMNPTAWWTRALALGLQRRWEPAFEADARALRLDEGFSDVTSHRAELMLLTGRPTEAITLAEQALALEPSNSVANGWPLYTRCRASLALDRYDDAIAACEKSAALHDWWMPRLYLVAAYTHKGQSENAAAEKAKVLKQRPDISIADFKAFRLSDNPDFLQQTESHLFAELRKAGIPEK
jgi:adenylate cyclase